MELEAEGGLSVHSGMWVMGGEVGRGWQWREGQGC